MTKIADAVWLRSGRHLTDDEISGMLIGLLLAGQHTSSTTSSWLGFFLAKHPEIQVVHSVLICWCFVTCIKQMYTNVPALVCVMSQVLQPWKGQRSFTRESVGG